MLKISVDYLTEFTQDHVSEFFGQPVQAGIYRFVEDRGGFDEILYLGEIDEIDLSSDIEPEGDGIFIERDEGVLIVNDNLYECPPAQYIRVGKN
jgi:hypothetical protein